MLNIDKEHTRIRRDGRSGSALVVTLLVVSLMLILVLGFAAWVRMALRELEARQSLHLARANAKLGLMLAVARLQETTGPDQRVTARAGLLDGVSQPDWTGVWVSPARLSDFDLDQGARLRAQVMVGEPGWLVSGAEAAGFRMQDFQPQFAGGSRNAVQIEAGTNRQVAVPLVPVSDTGRYAFWVEDEGVKARVDLAQEPPVADSRFGPPAANAAELSCPGLRLDAANGKARMVSRDSLELVADAVTPDGPDWRRDATVWSRGLLTNTKSGGLKTDLTAAFEEAAPLSDLMAADVPGLVSSLAERDQSHGKDGRLWVIPQTGDTVRWIPFAQYYNLYKAAVPVWLTGPYTRPPSGLAGGRKDRLPPQRLAYPPASGFGEQGGLTPVLLGFKLEIALSTALVAGGGTADDSDDRYALRVHFIPALVLWNPYDVAISGASADGSAPGPSYGLQGNLYAVNENVLRIRNVTTGETLFSENLTRFALRKEIGWWRLQTRSGEGDFEPGELRVYGLDADVTEPEALGQLTVDSADGWGLVREVPLAAPLPGTDALQAEFFNQIRANNFQYVTSGVQGWPWGYGLSYDWRLFRVGDFVISGGGGYEEVFDSPIAVSGLEGAVQRVSSFLLRTKGRFPHPPPDGRAPLRVANQGASGGAYNPARFDAAIDLMDYDNRVGAGFTSSEEFQRDGSGRTGWGELDVGRDAMSGPLALREVPRAPMLSLGQLRHCGTLQFASLYAFGDSRPSPRVPRDEVLLQWRVGGTTHLEVDDQWLNNEALFDGFFFSTFPPATLAADTELPEAWADFDPAEPGSGFLHSRFSLRGSGLTPEQRLAELRDLNRVASHLMVEGAFNVHSTSVDAWKALLGGLREHAGVYPFSRWVRQRAALPPGADYLTANERGVRVLDADELEALAEALVAEVRARGPFLSLADFVNRRLENGPRGEAGALQAALDASGVNDDAFAVLGADTTLAGYHVTQHSQAPEYTPASTADGAPGIITQGDLLQALAPILTARSDTFTVTAYGENGPSAGPGERAELEAVVQRIPDYVDSGNAPWERGSGLSEVNRRFGRRYRIVAMKWRSPD